MLIMLNSSLLLTMVIRILNTDLMLTLFYSIVDCVGMLTVFVTVLSAGLLLMLFIKDGQVEEPARSDNDGYDHVLDK